MNITFVTGNPNKVAQLSRHLSFPIEHRKLDIPEIQTLDLKESVEYKARAAYAQLQSPVLVEDTSVVFHALGKLPGPFIKWFLENLGNDGLCKILDAYEDRSATVTNCFGLFDGTTFRIFDASAQGTIAKSPRGSGGFGWDPVFIYEGSDKTRAELSDEEYQTRSQRRVATEKLEVFLKSRS